MRKFQIFLIVAIIVCHFVETNPVIQGSINNYKQFVQFQDSVNKFFTSSNKQ
jgi:glutaredoxin-related protein